MQKDLDRKKLEHERLLRDGVHIETNDTALSEEELRILSALRDPAKGPKLYELMNK